MTTPHQTPPSVKKPKKKGPIRTEAAVPLLIVIVLTWGYFHFLFDRNLKSALEYLGYQVIGAQVDIASLETSFWKGSFRLQGLQITNAQKPTSNMVAIGDIRFDVLWDGLLRARFVVDEMAVEQIQIDVPRKSPGRVKPPVPIKPGDKGPSKLEKEANKLKDRALDQTEAKYNDNVLGDLAGLLGGASGDDQLAKIEGTLTSKKRLNELTQAYNEKSKVWQQKIAALPKPKEIDALGEKVKKIKTSNFKSPQELVESVNQLKAVAEEADQKYKNLAETGSTINTDLKQFEQGLNELDALVQKDIAELENRFKIPKLDAKNLAQSLFRPYIDPSLQRLSQYRGMAEKYMPPNLMKKGKPDEVDIQMQPRPRADGTTYEFGKPKSYPIFWVRKISISSKASPTLGTGNLAGLITDVTSNQVLIGKPTTASLKGDFPTMSIQGFEFKGTFDNLKADSKISYDMNVADYPIVGRSIVQSADVTIAFEKAQASIQSKGQLVGLRDFEFTLNNDLKQVDYQIQAKNEIVDSILKNVFKSLPVLTIDVQGEGRLPGLGLAINSNLGPELQRGFENAVKAKIDEAKLKVQNFINEQVGKEKAKLEGNFNKVKGQVDGEIKKLQSQLDSKKKEAEGKMNVAKKDEENKAKKGIENEAKKAAEELKKRLGF
ncbi:MAG: TIGR03545 family protein [Bdellovibrio sp.]